MQSKRHWLMTRSGRKFVLNAPSESMVRWDDIGEALAKMCRFNGHCRGFYSVAQHSILVADALYAEYRIYGLLHDAHEAYIGDIISPVKKSIGMSRQSHLDAMQDAIDKCIYAAVKIPPPDETLAQRIRVADMRALATEWRDLIDHDGQPLFEDEDLRPFKAPIATLSSWQAARALYMKDLGQELRQRGVDVDLDWATRSWT